MKKEILIILIIGLVLLGGCVSETKTIDDGKRLEFKEEWGKCEIDSDCVSIDLTCCGCKNVPTDEVLNFINKKYGEEIEVERETLCKNIICQEEYVGNIYDTSGNKIYKPSKKEGKCTPFNIKCSANKMCRDFRKYWELWEDVSDKDKQMAIDLVEREHPEIIEKIPAPMHIHTIQDQPDNIELFYSIPRAIPEDHHDATIIINVIEQKIVSVSKRGFIWEDKE